MCLYLSRVPLLYPLPPLKQGIKQERGRHGIQQTRDLTQQGREGVPADGEGDSQGDSCAAGLGIATGNNHSRRRQVRRLHRGVSRKIKPLENLMCLNVMRYLNLKAEFRLELMLYIQSK